MVKNYHHHRRCLLLVHCPFSHHQKKLKKAPFSFVVLVSLALNEEE